MPALAIGRDTVVSLDIELADFWGNTLQQSDAPVNYLHGGYGDLLPALERALEGKCVGDRLTLRLEPEDAFGEYDEMLLRLEPRASFPEVLEVGMQFEGIPGGAPEHTIYTVTDIAGDSVVLDGNHPLAGIGLEIRCAVRAIRAANESEIARGGLDEPDGLGLRVLTH
jgi:FKBP-type peptidyl-prolyl cis-trans isomerase SlyD